MKKFITLLYIIFLHAATSAQFVYTNEDCIGARPLIATTNGELTDSVFQKNTYAAVASTPNLDCSGANAYYDLWYSFTAAQSTAYLKKNSTVKIQVFSGTCASLTSISCDTNLTGLISGQQYYVRTYQTNNQIANTGEFQLNLLNPLTNDDCNNASLVTVAPGNNPLTYLKKYSTDFATASGSSCTNVAAWLTLKDVWFKFVATTSAHSIYIKCPTTTKALAFSGTPGSLTNIGSFNISFGAYEGFINLTNLTVGQTYYLAVGSPAGSPFSFVICSPPALDECANADTVMMSTGFECENTFSTNHYGATTSTSPCNDVVDRDVWHIFKATSTDIVVRALGDLPGSTKLQLFDGSCGSLTCLVSYALNYFKYSGLTVGNYYYLRSGNIYQPTQICISPYINNDDCSGAVTLPVNPYGAIFSNYGFSTTATSSLPKCNNAQPSKDVWYKFTAIDTVCLINAFYESGASNYEVFSGTCGSLNSIFCSAASVKRVGGLTIGNSYYVRTYDALTSGLFTFDITSVPSNDECNGATPLAIQPDLFYDNIYDNGIADATTSAAPCVATFATNDIWYTFTPTQTSATIISHSQTSNLNTYDINFEIYSGTCGSLNNIACVTQSVQHQVITLNNLIANQTYFIRQYGVYKQNRISIVNHPSNDKITGAIALKSFPANCSSLNSYTTHGATVDFGKICSSSSQPFRDVWFYFVANASAQTISIGNYDKYWDTKVTGLNYKLETFDGFANDSVSLAAKLISCGNNSLSLTGLSVGDTVYIRLFNNGGLNTTSIFSININNSQSFDEPTGALLLNANKVLEYQISTSGATQTLPSSGCILTDFPDDDVWFKFIAGANAKRVIAGFETKNITLQLFSGTPGNLTAIMCSNNILLLPGNLTTGTTYYVRAYSKANAQASQFRIGLFDESDGVSNNCLSNNCVGPNLIANPKCESTYPFLIPPNDGTIIQGKLTEGWWNATARTADRWDADYPIGELGNVLGDTAEEAYSKNAIPRDGKGMLGMLYQSAPDWSEYVTGKLNTPMITGKEYIVSFYVLMSSSYLNNLCNNIGAFLSTDSLLTQTSEHIELKPHISNPPNQRITATTTWTNICGSIIAAQPYQYITIGNFGPKQIANNLPGFTYFFIDEVLVAENLCSTTGIEENPAGKTTAMSLVVFPNPANDYITIQWNENITGEAVFILTDITGREIKRISAFEKSGGHTSIDTHLLSPGFYNVTLYDNKLKATSKFVISR
ncbi:MAG: T9SS type A sorting domain-containing protein [Bacteroidota bacterium]